MLECFIVGPDEGAVPLVFIETDQLATWLKQQTIHLQNWVKATGFAAKPDSICIIPDEQYKSGKVLVGCNSLTDFWLAGGLPALLPEGSYRIEQLLAENIMANIAIAWGLGAYQFTRYKKPQKTMARLVLPEQAHHIEPVVQSIYLIRDLINTPTEDMGPGELALVAESMAREFAAHFSQIVGDELLQQNFPAIHAVGRASAQAPRLIDIRWGDSKNPKVTLVGKGVCFDTGGLDIKGASAMLLMKKDMGGAAHALGLARLIMAAKLPIRLRVLIPAVENVISANAYRPGDVLKTRQGLTVEIGNTDAEGRLILADALTEACAERPDLIIDFATLTGAARAALGTDIPALFTDNESLADSLAKWAKLSQDPLWRLPLYAPYRQMLDSPIADINNATASGYAGAITAGLFLKEFVGNDIPWAHLDLMAWNISSRPGRPNGGEAMGLRAVYAYLQQTYA